MPKLIRVGKDVVSFPDSMADADIERVLAEQYKPDSWAQINADVRAQQPARDEVRRSMLAHEIATTSEPTVRAGLQAELAATQGGKAYPTYDSALRGVALAGNPVGAAPAPVGAAPAPVGRAPAPVALDPQESAAAGLGPMYGEFETGTDQVATGGPIEAPSFETIGSLGGTVAGGVLGTALAPGFGTAAGATVGSALGAAAGAYADARAKGQNPEAARDTALRAAGVDLMWSAGGGVAIKFGGKLVKFAGGDKAAKWIAEKLGGPSGAVQEAVGVEKTKAGLAVFEDTTSPRQAAAAAKAAVNTLQAEAAAAGRPGLLPGQMSNKFSWAEKQVGVQEGALLQEAREGATGQIERGIVSERNRIAGRDMGPELARAQTGQKLQKAIEATEDATKNKHRSTFEMLADPNGPLRGAGGIDVSDIKQFVDAELAKSTNPEKIATLKELQRVLKDSDQIGLTRANELIKDWGAEAASATKLGQPDDVIKALYSRLGSQMRGKFNTALDAAVTNGAITPELKASIEAAKNDYRIMHEVLYSPTGSKLQRVAQTTPEDVLNVIAQKGATTEIGELRQIVALAGSSGNAKAAKDARNALRELRATYFQRELPDVKALAALPEKMRTDKQFADQFRLLFPEQDGARQSIERLSQAAQIVQRAPQGGINSGLVTGLAVGAGSTAGAAVGGPVVAAIGAALGFGAATKGREILAHSLTKPALRDRMPAVSAYALALASGKRVAVPQAVQAWYDELKADGLVQ